jgi:hypothetical protein
MIEEPQFRIDRNGIWYYQGEQINREEMVFLFSSLISLNDNNQHVVYTADEEVKIFVEDAPFIITDFYRNCDDCSQLITFKTNINEMVTLENDSQIKVEVKNNVKKIYIKIRDGIYAKITSKIAKDLLKISCEEIIDNKKRIGICSGGKFFPIFE